jgi:hypothetical protein
MVISTNIKVFLPLSNLIGKTPIAHKAPGTQNFATPEKVGDRFKVKFINLSYN